MEWILIFLLARGGNPATPEHYVLHSVEFHDRAACEFVRYRWTQAVQKLGWRVDSDCAPKGAMQMRPEDRREWEARFPPRPATP